MKNWQITGFLAILIIGFSLICGCTTDESTKSAPEVVNTPTPQVMVTVTDAATPTATDTRTQDPIIGVWRYNDSSGFDERYRFSPDGTFMQSVYSVNESKNFVLQGKWKRQDRDSYSLLYTSTATHASIKYDPLWDTIYDMEYAPLLLSRYQGEVGH